MYDQMQSQRQHLKVSAHEQADSVYITNSIYNSDTSMKLTYEQARWLAWALMCLFASPYATLPLTEALKR